MKRNLLALSAVVLAVVFSSFSTSRFATLYFVYKGSGDEKTISNYTPQQSNPLAFDGIDVVKWLRVDNISNINSPTQTEFSAGFELVDGDYGGSDNDMLSDETSEDATRFEKVEN